MIITRTPYRISFVGGGTDLRSFYSLNGGAVISTSLKKYIYVIVKKQIGIVEHKYRINWSKVEFKNNIDDIEHPIVRETLRKFKIDFPIEITTIADIPANSGLGSSSSFAVGLLNALYALKGKMISKYQLAKEASEIEVDILKRNIGKQDHFAAAYGNLNYYEFKKNENVIVNPVLINQSTRQILENRLLLFFTNMSRDANKILKQQNNNPIKYYENLNSIKNLVLPLKTVLETGKNLSFLPRALNENWKIKKEISKNKQNFKIHSYYKKALKNGAEGGKLLGAGGGGFLLIYAKKKYHKKIKNSLNKLYCLPVEFDISGSRITYYDKTSF